MASIQERLQMKREPLDKWSTREQLCLVSAVNRSGDQNWMSVSRALKPFGEPNRPSDWFHQKNCAAQFGALLANVETPKRKKRASGTDLGIETPVETILRKLLQERQTELKTLLAEERAEYIKLQEDMQLLQSGKVSEEQLDIWCKEIDEEEQKKEEESIAHAQWLKERELRKQEIERAWRPAKPQPVGLKRKNSDSVDSLFENDHDDQQQAHQQHQQEPPKPALSPLLTSLLKSPSQVQNVVTSSILHSAITNQRPVSTNTNPMIASLLNSSANVSVSPSLQQLVSSAIGQEQENDSEEQVQSMGSDILDDATLPNLKIDDLANSILVPDGPLPEIKNEEVDVIISDLIENAHDIVADPEQHLQLDNNGDISINLELDDLEENEEAQIADNKDIQVNKPIAKPAPAIDPFEFQEDPEIFQHTKMSTSIKQQQFQQQQQLQQQIQQQHIQMQQQLQHQQQQQQIQQFQQQQLQQMQHQFQQPQYQQNQFPQQEAFQQFEAQIQSQLSESSKNFSHTGGGEESNLGQRFEEAPPPKDTKVKDVTEREHRKDKKGNVPGSVEIVEVVVMEDEEIDKQLNRSQIQDIVHSTKIEGSKESNKDKNSDVDKSKDTAESQKKDTEVEVKNEDPNEAREKTNRETHLKAGKSESEDKRLDKHEERRHIKSEVDLRSSSEYERLSSLKTEFSDELYDDINMEIKIDKSGKAKRDYSRMKKKEEKEFDLLVALERTQLSDADLGDFTFSDKECHDKDEKKIVKDKVKSETERSSSPWTEEEDSVVSRLKRRVSTPATPIDSIPNSPASSSANYDDDREYRNWKKSVMLVFSRLTTHKYASLFLKPITDDQAPGYHGIVFRPTDLQTIRKNIESGAIRTTLEFQRDVMLMFTNAIMYNKTNDTVYNMARQMQRESLEQIQILLEATQQEDGPLKRETRTSELGNKRKRGPEDFIRTKKRKDD